VPGIEDDGPGTLGLTGNHKERTMPKIGNACQVWWRIVIGLVLGGVYGYGLFVVGFVGLAAGLNTFFLILATSPLGIGAWLWPVVGVLLGMSRYQWAGWTAFGIVLGHELSVSATFLVDPKLLGQFLCPLLGGYPRLIGFI